MTNPSSTTPPAGNDEPLVTRVRHETKRRSLTVRSAERITPAMLRIVLAGGELDGFYSASPDDHIKLFVKTADGGVEMRDYTPRLHDRAAGTLAVDFAIHDAGPATLWALAARPGDSLEIGGPRGSAVLAESVKNIILIGDETALPSIGRRIEEAGAGIRITAIVAVAGPAEEQDFLTEADLNLIWAYRPPTDGTDASALLAALAEVTIEPDAFIWIAAEASVTRAIRAQIVETRGHPLSRIKAAGYWKQGVADAHEKIED
jgi:NADPH-dependent ferric siderophore reductase